MDCHKEISSRRFIDHVWRVFHVNVGISGLIRFRSTVLRCVILSLTVKKMSRSMPTQTRVYTRTRHSRIEKLAHHRQSIIWRHPSNVAQSNRHGLLRWCEGGLKTVEAVWL